MEYKRERIKGYEEYEVDTDGIVYSKKGRPLKYSLNHRGYCIVNFMVNGKRKGFGVHTLVAKQFIPNSDITKTQVNHKNGNKEKNDVNNLEWVTPEENIDHAKNVLKAFKSSGDNPNAKRIYAYDKKNHELIYEFDSLADATRFFAKKLNKSFKSVQTSIYRVVHNYRRSYMNLIWKYEN